MSAKDNIQKLLDKYGKIKLSNISKSDIEKGKKFISDQDLFLVKLDGRPLKFEEINNPIHLVQYLSSKNKVRDLSEQYISHYTSFYSLMKILEGGKIHLANPANMNDGLEFSSKSMDCTKTYFTSFTLENGENIGMWSMYGQPWEDGVKISIPKKFFLKWPEQINKAYIVDNNDPNKLLKDPLEASDLKASFSRVAYVEWEGKSKISSIRCGEKAENTKLKKVDFKILSGYIKDSAWSYEKEIRLRVDLKDKVDNNKLAIELPKDILDNIIVTTGPRFDYIKNDLKLLHIKNINESIYEGKLNYVYCDKCKTKAK